MRSKGLPFGYGVHMWLVAHKDDPLLWIVVALLIVLGLWAIDPMR